MARTRKKPADAPAAAGDAPAGETKAQAEFARFKERSASAADTAGGPVGFGTPLPRGAVPAWSLGAPPQYPPAPQSPWSTSTAGAGATQSLGESAGQTIRLGVELVNAALARSVRMLNDLGGALGSYGWDDGCGCGGCGCDCCGYDCCCLMGCGCGRCEPSVGSCC